MRVISGIVPFFHTMGEVIRHRHEITAPKNGQGTSWFSNPFRNIDVKDTLLSAKNFLKAHFLSKFLGEIYLVPLLFRLRKPDLLGENHPWNTGICAQSQQPIWPNNILFQTTRSATHTLGQLSDTQIVTNVGKYLAALARGALSKYQYDENGKKMPGPPNAVNYLHGSVQHNGAFMIFEDFRDAARHLADQKFVVEMHRFVKNEQRDIVLVFRQKNYDPAAYAYFTSFLIGRTGWFANANGPQGKVLAGNHAPFASNNLVIGPWADDLRQLAKGNTEAIVKPSLESVRRNFFQETYGVNVEGRVYNFIDSVYPPWKNDQIENRGRKNFLYDFKNTHKKKYFDKSGKPRMTFPVELSFNRAVGT